MNRNVLRKCSESLQLSEKFGMINGVADNMSYRFFIGRYWNGFHSKISNI